MRGLLAAFATIWAVTAAGWAIGRYGLLGPRGETVLARLVFFVATPALLFDTLATTELTDVFTPALAAFVVSTLGVVVLFLVWAGLMWRRSTGDTTIGTMAAGYVNAGNLGIPVAAYALDDVAFVIPVLLFQLLFFTPVALAALETDAHPGRRVGTRLARLPARNPIILASAAGLTISIVGWNPPEEVLRPFTLVGNAAVPLALLALGMSLAGPRAVPERSDASARYVIIALKVLGQPLLAYVFGRFVLGLQGPLLLAAVITAGLPTAQNVFVYAIRYDRSEGLARDSVVVTTVVATISLLGIAFWLG